MSYIIKENKELMNEWNYDKNYNLDINVITSGSDKKAWWKCSKCGYEWLTKINTRTRGSGCPQCAEIARNEKKVTPKSGESLKDKSPHLLLEWDYEKNDKNPESYYNNSNLKVWWKCRVCNHEWQTAISDRVRGNGCPNCARMLLASNKKKPNLGESLEESLPEIAKEWNYEKNSFLPSECKIHSNQRVWWKCNKGHEWEASVNNRTRGQKCPYCIGKKIIKGENDFKSLFPKIAAEWNYEKNVCKPEEFRPASNKKVWWKCNKGHEWEATINGRTGGTNCPYCSGRIVIKGENDLASTFPELLKEWNYEKNKIDPSEVSYGSNTRVWWKCSKGHEWETTVSNRTTLRRGCSECSKELRTSFPELAVYYYAKLLYPDTISGNREILDGLELDIYIPSKKVAIEYDGVRWHNSSAAIEREIRKNKLCKDKGIELIRIREHGLSAIENCYSIIRGDSRDYSLKSSIIKTFKHIGVDKPDIDLKRDRFDIYSIIELSDKENSLANKYPEIASEWNYEKNKKLLPTMVSSNSNIRVWWKCSKGHEWESNINNRIRVPKCPYCNGSKVFKGSNDLLTLYPNLCMEWDYEKNIDISPDSVLPGSPKRVWWKCKECGNKWKTSINHRVNGTKCPKCMKLAATKKKNKPKIKESLADIYPEIASEWNYEKNNSKPTEYLPHSQKKVWWKCSKGHEYEAKIGNRTSLNRGCPYCYGRYPIVGENDFATTYPNLSKFWDYNKNNNKPEDFLSHSQKKVWWKCNKGHSYQRIISSQVLQNGKCPICNLKK